MELSEMGSKNSHQLHKIIGKLIQSHFSNCVKGPDCGGHRIPLYCSDKNKNATKYCDVDLLILKDEKIKVIIEIEESDITPIRIFGKVLASALSSYYIYDSKYGMDNSVKFIQILNASKLEEGSSKREQFNNIQKSIQDRIQDKKFTKIKEYELFCVDCKNNLELDKDQIIDSIHKF